MKISELQIGDWVYLNENARYPMQVVSIFGSLGDDEGTVYLDFEGNEGDVFESDVKDIFPIPITEEFLADNGFEYLPTYWNKNKNYFKLPDKRFALFSVMDSDKTSYRIRGMGINVKYVHELQNALRMVGVELDGYKKEEDGELSFTYSIGNFDTLSIKLLRYLITGEKKI